MLVRVMLPLKPARKLEGVDENPGGKKEQVVLVLAQTVPLYGVVVV
jgi:hypothetical protein